MTKNNQRQKLNALPVRIDIHHRIPPFPVQLQLQEEGLFHKLSAAPQDKQLLLSPENPKFSIKNMP